MELMEKGTVIKSTGSWYLVRFPDEQVVECRIRGKFRLEGIRTTNPVAVGDWVKVEKSQEGYVIVGIEPRKNYIIRKSTNLSKESHIIASNVDQAILVVTVNHPETSTVFIDRFLASAEAYNVPTVLVFNKLDLYDEEDRMLLGGLEMIYEKIGYPCYAVSTVTGENIAQIQELLKGKISVFSGLSGVGKSSLINRIEPGLQLKTAVISDAHDSGKHTTTFAEMVNLSGGGYLIDTPGIRSFGMIDMKKEEISHYFREIFAVSEACRFNNCTHTHEPGCAVLEAIELKEISESRYSSYLSMLEEHGKYR
jgi:ribosome biogenesis GTPase